MKNVALITGASSGIGYELAKIHAMNNKDLVIVARREEKLKELKEELEQKYNIEVYIIVKDLSLPNSALEIYEEVKQNNIEVEYLINNAGFGGYGLFYERNLEDDINMINVNILTLTKLTRLFLDDFVKNDKGKILNISSIASLMPGPLQAVYFASKAYVRSFSNALSEELKNTNITVTTLLPGPTKTEFEQRANLEGANMGFDFSPQKVALSGYKAMEKGKLELIVGVPRTQYIGLKLLKFVPQRLQLKIIFKAQSKEK